MIIQFIKSLLLFVLVLLPLQLVGYVVLAVVLPFIPRDKETLPRCIRWFDNNEYWFRGLDHIRLRAKYELHEDVAFSYEQFLVVYHDFDGLAGPDYFRIDNEIYPFNRSTDSKLKLFWHRWKWLAVRNPVNYFQYKVTGKRLDGYNVQDYTLMPIGMSKPLVLAIWDSSISQDPNMALYLGGVDINSTGFGGTESIKMVHEKTGKALYGFSVILPYRLPWAGPLCLRLRFGHKLGLKIDKGEVAQSVLSLNPVKGFEGSIDSWYMNYTAERFKAQHPEWSRYFQ